MALQRTLMSAGRRYHWSRSHLEYQQWPRAYHQCTSARASVPVVKLCRMRSSVTKPNISSDRTLSWRSSVMESGLHELPGAPPRLGAPRTGAQHPQEVRRAREAVSWWQISIGYTMELG